MSFISIKFIIFLITVFFIYWKLFPKLKYQNLFLVIASYLFYSLWDWRFSLLLSFSTIIAFISGILIHQTENYIVKKGILIICTSVMILILGFFKYYNFFIGSLINNIHNLSTNNTFSIINIVVPLGISFYTFHGISYVIDIYKKTITPSNSIINYSLFVCFFSLLIAGPIERANHFLPQINTLRKFNYAQATNGLRQILWGLFKKLVIADGCATYVNLIFDNSTYYSGSTLVVGAVFFSFQIYGDFSGYSDIAIGIGRLFGFELLQNFHFPYFSKNLGEFWTRWHISLSTWFRDYVYIPLGGNRNGKLIEIRNILIVFFLSGLWHGANWTFIVWGLLNAIYFIPNILIKKPIGEPMRRNSEVKTIIIHISQTLLTFMLVSFAWIIFRSKDLNHALQYIIAIFNMNIFKLPGAETYSKHLILSILIFLIIEYLGRKQKYAIENLVLLKSKALRWSAYAVILFFIGVWMETHESPFIYFQF